MKVSTVTEVFMTEAEIFPAFTLFQSHAFVLLGHFVKLLFKEENFQHITIC